MEFIAREPKRARQYTASGFEALPVEFLLSR
jgi:hypothetical protein